MKRSRQSSGAAAQIAIRRAAPAAAGPHARFVGFAFSGILLVANISLCAQESLRLSLASAQAASARHEAAGMVGYYNLKAGPSEWAFAAGLGLEANDNIRLEASNGRADLIFRPELNARMLWPVSAVNRLSFSVGGGYSAYATRSEFNRFYITPGSELSFDLYVGDFWISFHERLSMTEDNYQDPTVVGSADYTLLQNVLGQTTTWDLNKAVVRLGYDHVNYVTVLGAADASHPDGESEVFYSSAGYRLASGTLAGFEVGGSLVSYTRTTTDAFFSNATEWNLGSFAESQLSQYIRGRASVGYTVYTPDLSGVRASFDFKGIYAEIAMTHRVNQYATYTLTGGRKVNFAFYGGTIDLYFIRWQASWNLLRKITLSTSFEYDHGSQLGLGGETFNRYGPAITVGRALNRKLSASLSYQYFWRSSDLAARDYNNNILTLNGIYQF